MTTAEFMILKILDESDLSSMRATEILDRQDRQVLYAWRIQAVSSKLRSLELRSLVYRPDPVAGLWCLTKYGERLVAA